MINLLQPDKKISCITNISLEELQIGDYAGLVIDIDNTIMPYGERTIPDNIRNWLALAESMNFGIHFISNTLKNRADYVEKTLGYPACHQSMKPIKRGFLQAQNYLQLPPDRIVMIGDQVFTDILGGNRAGFYTILVEPLNEKDFLLTKFFRWLENYLR